MNSNISRQIKDIQFRADNLTQGKPSLEDIEEFNKYNEELKGFLLNHLTDKDIIERVMKIPVIVNETKSEEITRNIIATILLYFSSGLLNYFQNKQKIENAMEKIREAKGMYSSIEFLMKNSA